MLCHLQAVERSASELLPLPYTQGSGMASTHVTVQNTAGSSPDPATAKTHAASLARDAYPQRLSE